MTDAVEGFGSAEPEQASSAEAQSSSLLVSSRVARLFSYWRSISGEGLPPLRRAFDPIMIPDLLRYITLIQPKGGREFQVALFGTALQDALGKEVTGLNVKDPLFGPAATIYLQVLNDITETNCGYITTREVELADGVE